MKREELLKLKGRKYRSFNGLIKIISDVNIEKDIVSVIFLDIDQKETIYGNTYSIKNFKNRIAAGDVKIIEE